MSDKARSPSLNGVNVLVIDDDEDAREIMCTTLRHVGALVAGAASTKQAYEVLRGFRPAVIVCDLRMPVEDGLSFARELRLTPELASTPMLAVTAYGQLFTRERLQATGFTEVLHKPIDPVELLHAIVTMSRAATNPAPWWSANTSTEP